MIEETEQAVIDWVNSFGLEKECTRLSELTDGNVLGDILNEISPDYFGQDVQSLNKDTEDNWALAAGNLRKLLRMLEGYYQTVLQKRIDMSSVNVNNIAKDNNPEDLMCLLELVVGAAVMCEDKAAFIGNIFQLNQASQNVLKGLVQEVLSKAEDLAGADGEAVETDEGDFEGEDEEVTEFSASSLDVTGGGADEDTVRTNEMLSHLQSERQRLLNEVQSLQQSNDSYKSELATLKESASAKDLEREAVEGSDRSVVLSLENANQKLSMELDELKRDYDLKISENHTLTSELKQSNQRVEASKEIQAKLEMETHQLADEVDILRDKGAKLVKAEQTIEKYSKKLEELIVLKKQNKEANDKLDAYLDQIHDLESANKGLATLNKMVENYKNKAIELEREKFEAISAAQMKEFSLNQLQTEFDALVTAKQFVEDELVNAKETMATLIEQAEERASPARSRTRSQSADIGGGGGLLGDSDMYETDTIPSLKEKVKKLEREVMALKAGGSIAEGDEAAQGAAEDLAVMQEELDDANRIRKEREESLFAAKKQVTELQHEVTKLQRQLADTEKHSAAAVSLKETTQKLGEASNTVRLLEEKLKEKETMINKLGQENGKLENYTKRTLATFKEKYMSVLQQMKEEKRDLELKIKNCVEKAEANQANWHREERLISSAMFEIGVRIMDRKIQSNLHGANSEYGGGGGANGGTFMGNQRDALTAQTSASKIGESSTAAAGGTGGSAGVERKLFANSGIGSPI